MTRVVGTEDRSPYIVDPLEALRAGRRVDAQLAQAALTRPRGVMRATHRQMEEIEAARQRQAALAVMTSSHG